MGFELDSSPHSLSLNCKTDAIKLFNPLQSLTFIGCAPVVPVADPVAVAAVEVPGVVIGEDGLEAVVDHVLDGFVLEQNRSLAINSNRDRNLEVLIHLDHLQ